MQRHQHSYLDDWQKQYKAQLSKRVQIDKVIKAQMAPIFNDQQEVTSTLLSMPNQQNIIATDENSQQLENPEYNNNLAYANLSKIADTQITQYVMDNLIKNRAVAQFNFHFNAIVESLKSESKLGKFSKLQLLDFIAKYLEKHTAKSNYNQSQNDEYGESMSYMPSNNVSLNQKLNFTPYKRPQAEDYEAENNTIQNIQSIKQQKRDIIKGNETQLWEDAQAREDIVHNALTPQQQALLTQKSLSQSSSSSSSSLINTPQPSQLTIAMIEQLYKDTDKPTYGKGKGTKQRYINELEKEGLKVPQEIQKTGKPNIKQWAITQFYQKMPVATVLAERVEGHGLKKRKNRLIVGGGLVSKIPPYQYHAIGDKYLLDLNQLKNNHLYVKYKKTGNAVCKVKSQPISVDGKDIVNDILQDKFNIKLFKLLSANEQQIIKGFIQMCHLDIKIESDTEIESLQNQYAILVGEIEAGNDSKEIKLKLKKFILLAIKENRICRQSGTQAIVDYCS